MLGYVSVDVDVDDVLNELDNEDLVEVLTKRGFFNEHSEKSQYEESVGILVDEMNKGGDSFRRGICDILEINYNTSREEILEEINNKLL